VARRTLTAKPGTTLGRAGGKRDADKINTTMFEAAQFVASRMEKKNGEDQA